MSSRESTASNVLTGPVAAARTCASVGSAKLAEPRAQATISLRRLSLAQTAAWHVGASGAGSLNR